MSRHACICTTTSAITVDQIREENMIIALFLPSTLPFFTAYGMAIRHRREFKNRVLISLILQKGQIRPARLRYGRGAASRSPTSEPQTKHSQTLMKPYQHRRTSRLFYNILLTLSLFLRHPHFICVQQPRTRRCLDIQLPNTITRPTHRTLPTKTTSFISSANQMTLFCGLQLALDDHL